MSKAARSKTEKSTCRGQISVQSQHGAFSACYIWEIQYHAARARVRPHAARTFAQHPRMDVCTPWACSCAVFSTAQLQPHSYRAQEGRRHPQSNQGPTQLLIIVTMPKMCPVSNRIRSRTPSDHHTCENQRVSRAMMKRCLLSNLSNLTRRCPTTLQVLVKPVTYLYHSMRSDATSSLMCMRRRYFEAVRSHSGMTHKSAPLAALHGRR